MPNVKKNSIYKGLALASCSLLAAGACVAEGDDNGWKIDLETLYYGETDRVTAVEPVIAAKKTNDDDSELSFKLTVDSLTGASHNGAAVSNSVQTFTSPSGTQYASTPGDVTLDDSFKDTRVAFNTQWTKSFATDWKYTVGGNFSNEYDFQSLSVNGGLSRDFNNRNTTLALGLSLESDTIDAVGGTPIGGSSMDVAGATNVLAKTQGTESKDITDFMIGITQVINRKTIMQFNYTMTDSSGYHTDPYKIVSVFNTTPDTWVESLYESRPENRTKNAFYWKTKYHTGRDIVDVSYRYMTDDWGINSHTIDAKYHYKFAPKQYLEPHIRWYSQTEADFYHEYLLTSDAVYASRANEYLSGDYRLGALSDITIGAKYGRILNNGAEFSFRLESMQQSGDSEPADLSAVIAQVGYSFKW